MATKFKTGRHKDTIYSLKYQIEQSSQGKEEKSEFTTTHSLLKILEQQLNFRLSYSRYDEQSRLTKAIETTEQDFNSPIVHFLSLICLFVEVLQL